MDTTGTASKDHHDRNEEKGESQEPDVMPPDLASAQQKARERGRWIAEAILKGVTGGIAREVVREGLKHLGL